MNNIHDKDWAEESWGGFSGMGNGSDWSLPEKKRDESTEEKSDETDSATDGHIP